MEDLRIKKLEIGVISINRKLEEHSELHAKDAIWKEMATEQLQKDRQDIGMLHEILKESQKQTAILLDVAPAIADLSSYAQKTYEVFKPLTKIAGYAIKLGTLAIVLWHGIKLIIAKTVAVSL